MKNNFDISDSKNNKDLFYILIAILLVDIIGIFLFRYFPKQFGKSINEWYTVFGIFAIMSDILVIFIGFMIARYIYTIMNWNFNPILFIATILVVQIIHDMIFATLVIPSVPTGSNIMVDYFKKYIKSNGIAALIADSVMVIAIAIIAMIFKKYCSDSLMYFILAFVLYSMCFIIYKR
jgi:hypothetical protein